MAEPIKFRIRGAGTETDAPTVEDFLDQVRDFIGILRGVETAIDERGETAIEWRVTNATKNSPVAIEITPYARHHATDVTNRVNLVRRYAAQGLRDLASGAHEQPAYFSAPVLGRVEKAARRVLNGLASTEVDFGGDVGEITITSKTAAVTAEAAEAILKPPKGRPYREMGTVEGYYISLGADEVGQTILHIKSRRTGDDVKCQIRGRALEEIRARRVGEVLDHRRVRVRGLLYFKQRGRIDRVVVHAIRFMPSESELPAPMDLIDPDYTGGLSTEAYLEAIRSGRPN